MRLSLVLNRASAPDSTGIRRNVMRAYREAD
jgi:hypothetical protein